MNEVLLSNDLTFKEAPSPAYEKTHNKMVLAVMG
jgi:hypothetical protein